MAKIADTNEKIAKAVTKGYKAVENTVVIKRIFMKILTNEEKEIFLLSVRQFHRHNNSWIRSKCRLRKRRKLCIYNSSRTR